MQRLLKVEFRWLPGPDVLGAARAVPSAELARSVTLINRSFFARTPRHIGPVRVLGPCGVAAPRGGGCPPLRAEGSRWVFRGLTGCRFPPCPATLFRRDGDHGDPDEHLRPRGPHPLHPSARTGGRPLRRVGGHSGLQLAAVGIRQPVAADPAAAPSRSPWRTGGSRACPRVRRPVLRAPFGAARRVPGGWHLLWWDELLTWAEGANLAAVRTCSGPARPTRSAVNSSG